MVKFTQKHSGSSRRRRFVLILILAIVIWGAINPQSFLNLWLTQDQQGRLWFQLGDYQRASRSFEDPRWKGYSQYAAEEFDTAERYFSQYQDADSLLAHANSLAHQMDYKGAKVAYEEMAKRYPDHPAPPANIKVIDAIIAAIKDSDPNRKSGSGKPSRKPGDGKSSADGEKAQDGAELEQYSADQLLQNPELKEMWLRQIQHDPSEFLTTKFYLQLEQEEGENR